MKKIHLIIVLLACSSVMLANTVKDTTIVLNQKKVVITDSLEKVKVEVYELSEDAEKPLKQVYVGIFSDDKNFEQYTVAEEIKFSIEDLGIPIPFVKKKNKKELEPHWAGFGLGFNSIADSRFNMTTVKGVSVLPERSMEWAFNFLEKIIPVSRSFGFTTGVGLNWKNFNLDDNTHFLKVDNVVGIYDAPDGITYKKSKFRTSYLTIPLLLEWQPQGSGSFFIAAGVVGGVKLSASHKIKYKDQNGNKGKEVESRGLNTPPLMMDCMVKAGYQNFSVYAKYSPFNLFKNGKGPEIKAVSAGVVLEF